MEVSESGTRQYECVAKITTLQKESDRLGGGNEWVQIVGGGIRIYDVSKNVAELFSKGDALLKICQTRNIFFFIEGLLGKDLPLIDNKILTKFHKNQFQMPTYLYYCMIIDERGNK